MYAVLKLRKPGWPPEGTSGSPVSVLMPGHKAPKDEKKREQMEAKGESSGDRRRVSPKAGQS